MNRGLASLSAQLAKAGGDLSRVRLGHVAYSLYSLERVGMFLDIQQIGDFDWL